MALWLSPVFIAAADCKLLYSLISFPLTMFFQLHTVVMILRVYAMWNQSKRILYILLFIYVPQVFISFIYQGIYKNSNTYLSGMSQAKLDSHTYPLVSYHLSLQLKLSKLLVLLHAIFQSTKAMPHYTYCGAWQFSELFLVLCFWFLLLPQP